MTKAERRAVARRWQLIESRATGEEDDLLFFVANFRTKRNAIRSLRRAIQDPLAGRITLVGPGLEAIFEKGEAEAHRFTKRGVREMSLKRLLGDLRGLPAFERPKPFVPVEFECSHD